MAELVSTEHHRDADQEDLLLVVIVLFFAEMLAEEFNRASVLELLLLQGDFVHDRLVNFIPISSRSFLVLILYFDYLPEHFYANYLEVFVKDSRV